MTRTPVKSAPSKKKAKHRLDRLVVERGLASSRQRARALVMSGRILVDNKPVGKPGASFPLHADIRMKGSDIPYVSRGGLKLEKALTRFEVDVCGWECMDVGASTGGFTDCLLQRGARYVFAVDVGYGQLAWKLRQDPRVKVIERTNIRHMPFQAVPRPLDLIVIDVSFISLKTVVPAVLKFLKRNAGIIALIKPQFEVGKGCVGKGGIVRHTGDHERVVAKLTAHFASLGFSICGVTASPILGQKGNREFIVYMKCQGCISA